MMRSIPADMAKLRGVQRPYAETAVRRLALLAQWLMDRDAAAARGMSLGRASAESVRKLRARGERVSLKTLHSWRRAYLEDGWRGLIDQRQKSDRPAADPRFLAEVRRLVRELENARRTALVHAMATETAKRRGWRPCTLRETHRYIQAIKVGGGGVDGR